MDRRQRLVISLMWIGVAGLIAITIDPGAPVDANTIARVVVVIGALFLAVVHLVDPWGVLSRRPFHTD